MNKINEQEKSIPKPPKDRVTGRDIAKISELIPPEDQKLVPINRIRDALEKLRQIIKHPNQDDQ
ncbi:MAG: hypothetical protein ACD_40C00149G0001 [uncultured bacterium]|nr:MAG: hypothetical protein ACD_40C00149G0001 [uncultured bacterium]